MRRRVFPPLTAAMLLHAASALAGHPMMTEDTGTQGTGNAELELGYEWAELGPNRGYFLFQPQLSWGVTPAFDLIVQPSWLLDQTRPGDTVRAFGDTNLDFKWRFLGMSPLTLGVRAGLQLPTSQEGEGIAHDRVAAHGILVATLDLEPFTFNFNAGMGRAPADPGGRSDLYHFSGAGMYALSERLFLVVDSSADTNPDVPGPRWQGMVLTGAIYTVRPGFDLDVGYETRLDGIGPAQQWLLGITVRGAP